MRKIFKITLSVILALMIAVTAVSCSKSESRSENKDGGENSQTQVQTVNELPTVIDTAEYVLYTNIFYNDTGNDYVGKEVVKRGTFTVLNDSYNNAVRYYVWGYNDQTKCCDWQWELMFDDTSSLPEPGSLITVKGTFEKSFYALDGYCITEPEITVEKAYSDPEPADINMSTMDGTLERVQIANIQYNPDEYEGKSVKGYGRVNNPTSVQDPYYDGSWTQDISTEEQMPAIGTMICFSAVCKNGVLSDAILSENTVY